jgi:C4-dicarboxylate transporter DctQ subunit
MMDETLLLRANRIFGRLQNVFVLIGAAFIALVVFMTGADVVMRWFGHPIRGVIEFSQLFMVPLIWLGVAYTMRVGGHVRMEMLSAVLFKGKKDIYYWIFVHITLLVFVFLMCLATYEGMVYAINGREFGDITGIPVYPFKAVLFGGCVLFALELFAELALDFASLGKGPKGRHE